MSRPRAAPREMVPEPVPGTWTRRSMALDALLWEMEAPFGFWEGLTVYHHSPIVKDWVTGASSAALLLALWCFGPLPARGRRSTAVGLFLRVVTIHGFETWR